MKAEQLRALRERNERIIRAVLEKEKQLCAGSIDLIGITGSFCSGDFYEKSDLDLLIVPNSGEAQKIACCFILEDVGHDLYCTPWESLEEMSRYHMPHVTKLLDIEWVYCREEACRARYDALRAKLIQRLNAPLSAEDIQNAETNLRQAESAYAHLMLCDQPGKRRKYALELILYTEYAVYLLNHACVRHGVRGIPQELMQMTLLPEGFLQQHQALVYAVGLDELRTAASALLRNVLDWFEALRDRVQETDKLEITAAALTGTYEEIHSNWRNKMYRSIEPADPYLSQMTAMSCQNFYDYMHEHYHIPYIDLFETLSSFDPAANAAAFDAAMEEYLHLYHQCDLPLRKYSSIEEFEADYLG